MNKIAELNALKEALAAEYLQKTSALDDMIKEAISNDLIRQAIKARLSKIDGL